MTSQFIPLLTTLSGSALSATDWEHIGITMVAAELEALLIKPGYRVLQASPSLANYMGWQNQMILNAFSLKTRSGRYLVRSPYDGHEVQFSADELICLINQLKPYGLILPPGAYFNMKEKLARNIRIFLPFNDLLALETIDSQLGLYIDSSTSIDKILEQRRHFAQLECYVSTIDCTESILSQLKAADIQWVESDKPAQDAVNGIVYQKSEPQEILLSTYENKHEVIWTECLCEGCQHQLTYAYFHHLYQHTPGLCHRFLIQHNVYNYSILIKNNNFL